MGKNKELNRKLKKLAGPPYRTPACDNHLSNNEDDECPWCRIEQLQAELKKLGSYRDFWVAHAQPEEKDDA